MFSVYTHLHTHTQKTHVRKGGKRWYKLVSEKASERRSEAE